MGVYEVLKTLRIHHPSTPPYSYSQLGAQNPINFPDKPESSYTIEFILPLCAGVHFKRFLIIDLFIVSDDLLIIIGGHFYYSKNYHYLGGWREP